MKKSVRAQRMARHHDRLSRQSKLNLVSLMDIFTILVFFLLLNSSDVEVLDNNHGVELPKSANESAGDNKTLKVSINDDGIWINKVHIKGSKESHNLLNDDTSITELSRLLQNKRQESSDSTATTVTLLAAKDTSFQVINRIMQLFSENGYEKVNFAVNKIHDNSNEG